MAKAAPGYRRLPHVPLERAVQLLEAGAIAFIVLRGLQWSLREGKGLLDWGSFIASGRAARDGLDPYGVYDLTFRVGPRAIPAPNLNPPVSIYPFEWVAPFDPRLTYHLWYVATLAMMGLAFLLLWRAYPRERTVTAFWAFALAGLWHTLELGQVYGPLVLAATVAWLRLRTRDDWLAGIALGFMAALKPQFLAWPALLLLARNWRAGGAAALTFALLWSVPLALEGGAIYRQWLAVTPPVGEANTLAGNSSLLAVGGRLGFAELALALAVLAGLALALLAALRRPGRLELSAAALVFALLAGPITWPGYTLVLVPVLFWAGWRTVLPAVVLLAFPYEAVILLETSGAASVRFVAGSVYFFGILLLLAILLAAARDWRLAGLPRRSSAAPGVVPAD